MWKAILRLALLTIICGIAAAPRVAAAQAIPAFPGADGAAANVSGGRGGIVYHVTKLNSAIDDPERNDPGTIRYGLTNANFPAGPRTIVFDVGGVFHLGRLPQVNWDPNGNGWDAQSRLTVGGANVTLAGQTAPGAGVIFIGGGLKPQGNNNIIRNITIASGYGLSGWYRPGDPFPPNTDFPDAVVYDAMDISGTNLMIDHVTAAYATDETISMNENANNITIQYTNMSQGQNYPQLDAEGGGHTGHALGSLLQAGSNAKISLHHNLYAHLKGRLPRVGSEVGTGAHNDFRNNVFYNWLGTAGAGASGQPSFNKFVGNFYLAGDGGDNPVGGSSTAITNANGGTGIFSGGSSSATRVYHAGNVKDTNKDADASDSVNLSNGDFSSSTFVTDASFTVPYHGVTDTAAAAFDRVLDYVGANWWTRDATIDTIDERIINEARTGTGKIVAWADDPFNSDPNEGVEWRAIKNTPLTARPDDWDIEASVGYGVGDGMPTWWELAYGLDPDARDDAGDFDSDGYTNLEEYLNEVAEWPAPRPIVFSAATNNRYAQITNWDIPWQPSKYDEAQINVGTVVVDAVGQHAGTLKIAAGDGNTAQLDVTGGWLLANDAVVIGGTAMAAGTLNLSGGVLATPLLDKGAAGTFNFTGGTLAAGVVNFDLVNNGGTLAPGQSPGVMVVIGNLTLNSGVLEIEIGGTVFGEYDRLEVTGVTQLGGTLQVKLVDLGGGVFAPELGDSFGFLASQLGTGGIFDALDLPALSPGLAWALNLDNVTNFLTVVAAALLAGDYNNDQVVDAADYVTWRKSMESQLPLANETASPGVVDDADYLAWRANFGATLGSGGAHAVPEPGTLLIALIFAAILPTIWKKVGRRRGPIQ